MLKKRQVVLNTAELTAPLADVQTPEDGPILLRSDRYFQVGCDLRDTDTLHQALSLIAEISRARLLFVAEVSITYMETEAADGLIKWASSIGQGMSPAVYFLHHHFPCISQRFATSIISILYCLVTDIRGSGVLFVGANLTGWS